MLFKFLFQIGQGNLGLGQKQYYMSETPVTIAYRQFMQSLAEALADDKTMIVQDVNDMFEFEKTIAKVLVPAFFLY